MNPGGFQIVSWGGAHNASMFNRLLQACTNYMLIFFKDHILIINIIKTSISYLFRTIKADIEFYHCKLIFLKF